MNEYRIEEEFRNFIFCFFVFYNFNIFYVKRNFLNVKEKMRFLFFLRSFLDMLLKIRVGTEKRFWNELYVECCGLI